MAERSRVESILGMRTSNDLERYLSLPTMVGHNKKIAFQNLRDRLL